MTHVSRLSSDAGGVRNAWSMLLLGLALAFGFGGVCGTTSAETSPALQQTIEDVARKWPAVTHIAADEVARLMTEKTAVIFDVRTPEEFAVSHLDGAVRIDPAADAAVFLKEHGTSVKGKTAVFYCSVGVRSSKLTARVADGLKAAGAAASGELKGGIFAWAGDARPLVDAKGPTDKVHGYDSSWGKLVKDPKTLETKERQ